MSGLNDKLNQFLTSKEGKERVAAACKTSYSKGKSFGGAVGIGTPGGGASHEFQFYADRLLEIMRHHIEISGFEYADYLIEVENQWDPKLEKWVIAFQFDPSRIHRDSLYPDEEKGYPEGAYDIVELMNHGYSADDVVYGTIRGADGTAKRVHSLQERQGSFFIQKAINEFNARYGKEAQAVYDTRYDGKYGDIAGLL